MARADLLVDLVDAERRGDRDRFRVLVEAVIAEERAKQHHLVADRLSELITTTGQNAPRDAHTETVGDLVQQVVPQRRLEDLELAAVPRRLLAELVEEHKRSDLLRSYGIEPRNRLLLSGPPGNGKTSVAEAIAAELMLPLYVVRYEGVVSSFLGETAARLDSVFEFARTRRCVLFFDELDSIAKERSDAHETGEIKRVVSTLLLQIDRLPPHVLLVGASNHSELLDRAAWRRFQIRAELSPPSRAQATRFLERLSARLGGDLGYSPRTLADKLAGASFSELEEFALDVRRRMILELPDGDSRRIAQGHLEHRRTEAVG
ncbi:AAA family ATPase [Corynebacterium otitidis]|uniref:AAA family ATPase n=1 Tax=Corynebacterium otitidis TaxID=29321 RepID=UPI00062793A2|nr:ATP-binding protein [Corynebacterium otitidis]KKO83098.1 ATPase AAA [Corynebacterium otitidis]